MKESETAAKKNESGEVVESSSFCCAKQELECDVEEMRERSDEDDGDGGGGNREAEEETAMDVPLKMCSCSSCVCMCYLMLLFFSFLCFLFLEACENSVQVRDALGYGTRTEEKEQSYWWLSAVINWFP